MWPDYAFIIFIVQLSSYKWRHGGGNTPQTFLNLHLYFIEKFIELTKCHEDNGPFNIHYSKTRGKVSHG